MKITVNFKNDTVEEFEGDIFLDQWRGTAPGLVPFNSRVAVFTTEFGSRVYNMDSVESFFITVHLTGGPDAGQKI